MMHKRVEDSLTEQTYLVMHKHINGYGRLFGGQLLAWIDELAGIVARRHAGSEVTTACIDQLHFKHPVYLNDTLVMIGRITYVGRTSMEVRIDSYVESLDGMRKLINRAYLVMVAMDMDNGTAVPVPALRLETEMQKAEWECGKRRTQLRKQRMEEGY
jgi:acyl-CoA hydrolase